jgi:dienelactone hydrolase
VRRARAIGAAAVAATALAVGLGGCGGDDDERPSGAAAPARSVQESVPAPAPASSEPDPRPEPAPPGRPVRFRATDGVSLRGSLVPGRARRAPAVVLVHESNGGPDQFDPFVPHLHARGYAALTYGSRPGSGRMDETRNARDIAGAVRALRRRSGIDPQRIAVVGASIGATSAAYLSFSSLGRGVRATVGLSPGTFLDEAPRGRAPRDLLLLSDEAERGSAEFIAEASPQVTTRVIPDGGHGVALLETASGREQVLEWLDEHLAG